MSFVFYDTETTGISKSFDQILQFAAIQTDPDLNEIDRFEVRSRILPGVLPSAYAMRVTGLRASQLVDPRLPSHYEMMRQIELKLLSWSPALFLGYNSINFDEQLLRHSLYKTLHLPYLTNTNGNSRSDVMKMVQAAYVFRSDSVAIPTDVDGKPSFKLDRVAPTNGFSHENAHDALADVQATIFMCRQIAENAPDIWSSFMRFGKKAAVIDYIDSEPIFCYSDVYFGRPFACLATGMRPDDSSSQYYIFDLAVDPDDLIQMDDRRLIRRLGASPKPVRAVRCNASPSLMSAEDAPAFVATATLGTDELERRATAIRNNSDLRERLIGLLEESKGEPQQSPHVEEQLYGGFFTDKDQELLARFHEAPWEHRPAIVADLDDGRLRQLGFQLIHVEKPELLEERVRTDLDRRIANRLLSAEDKLPWLTASKAEAEFDELLTEVRDNEKPFLLEHLTLLRERINQAKRVLGN